ncbi:MAG: D-alanyl-D-alanine carboxypeptidase family protein [Pseudomonadota bacterium]
MNRRTRIIVHQLVARSRIVGVLLALLMLPVSYSLAEENVDLFFDSTVRLSDVDAKAWVLMEFESGQTIASLNAEQAYPPASITKLMTNYVVYEALASGDIKLEDQVSISEKAWRAEGSRMFAKVNSQVELQHLLKSTVIQSGNDAAIALAEHTAGSEIAFAQKMNQAAARLSLKHSRFINSSGLPDDEHVMSARDIALLSAAIIREYPDFYKWYSEKEYTHNNITQYNRNKLLWRDSTVDGLKTGHTEAAGYCLVGSAEREGKRWIAVVLGSTDERTREKAVLDLLDYAFVAFQPVKLLDQQGGLASATVYFGEVDDVLFQAERAVNVVVPNGREADVVTDLRLSPYYTAPIEVGDKMGVATLSLDSKPIAEVPLVAMSTIKEGGLWKQFTDGIRLRWRNLREN